MGLPKDRWIKASNPVSGKSIFTLLEGRFQAVLDKV
jgi:hypothetical protein